jgi:hypothetical protein
MELEMLRRKEQAELEALRKQREKQEEMLRIKADI